MEAVEKLHDVKSAFINIEMDVPFLKEEVPIHENCANGFKSEIGTALSRNVVILLSV